MGLTGEALSGAGLDLSSSCRTTEQYPEALAAFEQWLARFPDTNEFKVFFAMICYSLGRNKEGWRACWRYRQRRRQIRLRPLTGTPSPSMPPIRIDAGK